VTSAPILFDKALARARLRRALRGGAATFLLEQALADLDDRLAAVTRDFRSVLELGGPTPQVAAALTSRFPQADVFRAAPDPLAVGSGSWLSLVADEELIPFGPDSFDLAISLLALQWANDLPGAIAQIRRTLKPDGLFLACLVGGQSLKELRLALAVAEEESLGGASPRVAPFVDLRDLGSLLQRAGFALPVTDVETLTVRYSDLFGLIGDLRAMGGANALVERSRRPLPRAVWARAAEVYAERFADSDGRVRATFELVWLSGWSPHESQRKPLAPGSARMRLADALGVAEGKLKR
jgi:SAM-dependent methyltransferase